jgi:hypothetical protein
MGPVEVEVALVVTLVYASECVVPRLGAHELLDPLDGKSHEELERVSAQSMRPVEVALAYSSNACVCQ